MDFAIIETGGKQYKVVPGQELDIERLTSADKNGRVIFDKVLLLADDGDIKIGKPYLTGIEISAEILAQKKGKKIRVARFSAKSRHRRVVGHRQRLTKIKVKAKEKAAKTAKVERVEK